MSKFACECVSLCGGRILVRLYLDAWVALVVAAVVYLDDAEVPTNGVRPKHREEFLVDKVSAGERNSRSAFPHLEISVVGKLVQVSHNTQ